MRHLPITILSCVLASAIAATGQPANGTIELRHGLALPSVGSSGRSALHTDALEALIVAGEWTAPVAGDEIEMPDGKRAAWVAVEADEKGWIGHPESRAGYLHCVVESENDRVMMLRGRGHLLVYVDGVLRTGDPYRTGYVHLPVSLRAGKSELLFRLARGPVRAELAPLPAPVHLDTADSTLPDLRPGVTESQMGATVVVNATAEVVSGLEVRATRAGAPTIVTALPPLQPLAVRKLGFTLPGAIDGDEGKVPVTLELGRPGESPMHVATLELRVRQSGQGHRRTFVSSIDGSVQYFAVKPASPSRNEGFVRRACFLTLHGAGVEAMGQANSYSSKSWGDVVAPTNRRPFGFDWEDWGRRDAIEVLDLALAQLGSDPERVYLTGHSMGGHGTWHLGVTYPDRFAAIAPSAGWVSFWSYGGKPRIPEDASPAERTLARASAPSDTLALLENLKGTSIYILHGDADDNVPVGEARTMVERLSVFHHDFQLHEQPGAGHWWDGEDEPGAACVDWAPMFDLFARRVRPRAVRDVDFRTASPAISSRMAWLTIEAAREHMEFAHARIRLDPHRRRFSGETENVARLSLDLEQLERGDTVNVALDGGDVDIAWPPTGDRITLARRDGAWKHIPPAPLALKGPHRYGPFRDAFTNRAALVYGTAGTPEENAWSYARARLDAEVFWVRGNGSFEVVSDVDLLAAASRDSDRNLVLYGSATTNEAWGPLLGESPIQVERGLLTVGETALEGDQLLALFVRPRPGSDTALVGAVAGTGLPGMHLSDRLPMFVSGIPFADYTILSTNVLTAPREGLVAAGYFAADWTLE